MPLAKPLTPLPEPLRGSEPGTFAEDTVRVRLKKIGNRTLDENTFSDAVSARLQGLIDELPDGKIRPLMDLGAPDAAGWQEYVQPYLGLTWLEVPWFFCETYFYRRILEVTGYYSHGEGQGRDPYQVQKRMGLEHNLEAIHIACQFAEQGLSQAGDRSSACRCLGDLLSLSLWGNQADLSMWPAGSSSPAGTQDRSETPTLKKNFLVNDLERASSYVCQIDQPRLDIILDNSGLELIHDLLAADFFLETHLVEQVVLHAKVHPTFVSDTVPEDLGDTIAFMRAASSPQVRRAGERFAGRINTGRLVIENDFYWNSPLAFWEAPDRVLQSLHGAGLVISKGDANYRRFLGDLHWPYDFPAHRAFSYLPFPFLALRVSKSEVAVGLQPGQPEQMDRIDPDWMVNGRWAMVQFTCR